MTRTELLKPFQLKTHVLLWLAYFAWVIPVNIKRFGAEHLPVVSIGIVVMLVITYLNRYLFRRLLFRPFASRQMLVIIGYFVLSMTAVYLWIYHFPGAVTRLLLAEPSQHDFVDFVIDFTTFYWSFGWKGVVIGGAEVLSNALRGWFVLLFIQRRLVQVNAQLEGWRHNNDRQFEMRRWIGHFLGNLAQGAKYAATNGVSSFKVLLATNSLWSYGMRIMGRAEISLVPLETELAELRKLMEVYPDRQIAVRWPQQDSGYAIVPLMILTLYKNMVKHGDFSPERQDRPASLAIDADKNSLIIRTDNAIAGHSLWMYEQGGTGLEQLEILLKQYFGESCAIAYHIHDGRFAVFLHIDYSDMQQVNHLSYEIDYT